MYEGQMNQRVHDKPADAVAVRESVHCPRRPEQEADAVYKSRWLGAKLHASSRAGMLTTSPTRPSGLERLRPHWELGLALQASRVRETDGAAGGNSPGRAGQTRMFKRTLGTLAVFC